MVATPVQLTSGGKEKWNPSISGSHILYADGSDNGEDLSRDVFIMDADGQNARQLSQHPGNLNYMPAASPDGQKIVYTSEVQGQGKADLYLINPDGSGETNLTHDNGGYWEPQWAPDQSAILCTSLASGTGATDLYLVRPDGSGKTNLTQGHGASHFGRFTPDGQGVVFASDMNDGRDEMYAMKMDGTGLSRLAPGVTVMDVPSPAPQGLVVFTGADAKGDEHLYEASLTDGQPAHIVGHPDSPLSGIFTPDGQHILYLADGAESNVQIFEMAPDGSNAQPLTSDKAFHIYPFCAPDGSSLIYAADNDQGSQLYRIPLQ